MAVFDKLMVFSWILHSVVGNCSDMSD